MPTSGQRVVIASSSQGVSAIRAKTPTRRQAVATKDEAGGGGIEGRERKGGEGEQAVTEVIADERG